MIYGRIRDVCGFVARYHVLVIYRYFLSWSQEKRWFVKLYTPEESSKAKRNRAMGSEVLPSNDGAAVEDIKVVLGNCIKRVGKDASRQSS